MIKSISLWLLGFMVSTLVFGQNESIQDESKLLELSLEELLNIEVTTASKTASKIDYAPGVIDVITAEQITQRGYRYLGQLLNDIANNHQDRANWGIGEPISQNVGFGFRFDSGQNILLLLNGQRLNAFLPGNRFGGEEYLLNSIEKIEIIRGPGSALYGTGAFTAVINIITKKFSFENEPSLSYQTHYIPTANGWMVNGTLLTPVGKSSVSASFRSSAETGQKLNIANSLFGNSTVKDGVNYAYDGEIVVSNKKLNVQGKFTKQSRETVTGFNGVNPNDLDELELYMHAYSIGADYSKKWNNVTLKLMAGSHQDNWTEVALIPIFKPQPNSLALPELDTVGLFRHGKKTLTSFFMDGQGATTRSLDAETQLTINYSKINNIVMGVYAADDKVLDAVRPSELNLDPLEFFPFREIRDPKNNWLFDSNASRQTIAGYFQADYNVLDNLLINAGARWDNYSGTGVLTNQKYSEFNPRGALVYVNDLIGTFKILAGRATRIPNGFETLSSVSILGNPLNTPERIQTYQFQWIKSWAKVRSEIGFFRSVISNRLETNANISEQLKSQGFIGQFVNVGSGIVQSNNGFDLRLVALLGKSNLNVNMTQYFNSNNGLGEAISYIPNTMINLDYTYPFRWISINIGMNYRASFKKPSDDPRTVVKNYLISRLYMSTNLPKSRIQFSVGATNLFNTQYYYPSSSRDFTNHFAARGIDLFLGITYKPSIVSQ